MEIEAAVLVLKKPYNHKLRKEISSTLDTTTPLNSIENTVATLTYLDSLACERDVSQYRLDQAESCVSAPG